ncbi:class I SAM-dependent RNA methyltransferase [soil metagenome]
MTTPAGETTITIDSLAAGGDAVGRDANGRVTFVPLAAPGDQVRVQLLKQTKSFARGEIIEIVTPSPERVTPACPAFLAGCGGCQWQHVSRTAQLAAKQAIVTAALRRVTTEIAPIAAPGPALGWRRRARFHVEQRKLGLYRTASHEVLPLGACPQLEPPLEAVLALLAEANRQTPMPDGEVAMLLGHRGEISLAFEAPWKGAAALVGNAGIVGVRSGPTSIGTPVIEVEPGLVGSPWDFAQANTAGNALLIKLVNAALGAGRGRLLELYAGAGNFTRSLIAAGWSVTPTDAAAPPKPPPHFYVATADRAVDKLQGPFDAVVLDPPRAGAPEAIEGIVKHAPKTIVYISCDPATLARDAERLVAGGYRAERAWPVDLMPQTSHIEVVLKLTKR